MMQTIPYADRPENEVLPQHLCRPSWLVIFHLIFYRFRQIPFHPVGVWVGFETGLSTKA